MQVVGLDQDAFWWNTGKEVAVVRGGRALGVKTKVSADSQKWFNKTGCSVEGMEKNAGG